MAHNEWELLKTLVGCIDDERNDIYVHIDAKVAGLPQLAAGHAGLTVIDERVDVRWGDVSVVEAEYALFRAAYKPGKYSYYHLLSGCDLPLKSQDYIHSFCEQNAGREFIGYTLTDINPEIVRKAMRWHFFPKEFREAKKWKRYLRAAALRGQELVGYRRNIDIDFKKGSQWVSVTEKMARYFLDHEVWVGDVFHHTFCSDEMVMQTIAWHYAWERIYDKDDDARGCMRARGWRNGQLVDWCAADYEELAASPALFARKFNSSDWDFIRKIASLSR